MSEYKLTREERETIITWSEVDEEMEITTWSQPMVRRLRKLAPEYNAEVQEIGFDCVQVSLPRKALTLRKPRVLSNEQKQAQTERLRKAREQG